MFDLMPLASSDSCFQPLSSVNVNGMSVAISPEGGAARVVGARLPHDDAARLADLASRANLTPSEALRECVKAGLDQLEKEADDPASRSG
jgi:hypothetical protein